MQIAVESLYLPTRRTGSLQQQIRQLVIEAILTGRMLPGDKLPSSRALARHLGISRITVTLAYGELVSSDYLTSRGRSGYFVSHSAPASLQFAGAAAQGLEQVDYGALSGFRYSRHMLLDKPEDWRTYPFAFIYGQSDPALFDHQNWRQCALQALGKRDFEALTADYHERDDPLLIEYIQRNILPRRGIQANADEVLMTMGAQNGLWLAAQVLLGQGRKAAMENPGYPDLRAIVRNTGCAMVCVDVDADGLPPQDLPPGCEVVFTTASHHCPTNATMPLERRLELLEAAQRNDFVVVEDDYEFEMSFLKPVSPSLKSLDTNGRVIHAGSFSKSIFPGLRLGYLVGPKSFIREARALRATVLRHPPGHIQRTAAYFLSLGHYEALINKMKQAYKRRRQAMQDAITEHGLEVAGQGGFGGSSFWMRAPANVDTGELALRLRQQGVLIEPGEAFFDPVAAKRNFYRLAYSSIPQVRIAEGIGRVAAAIAQTGPNGTQ